jgi:hypothetical protein
MKLSPVLLALRGVAFIVAAGFIFITLRGQLESKGTRLLDGVLGLSTIWIVYSLSMRSLFRELRADAVVSRWQIAADQFKDSEGRTETVHRYPWLLRYPLAAFGLIYVTLPYLNAEPGKSIALMTYVLCFGLASFSLSVAFYMFTYSVILKHDGIVVNAFGKREIAFSDVADTKLVRTAHGRQIVVTLKSGQVFRFGGKIDWLLHTIGRIDCTNTARNPLNATTLCHLVRF